MAISQHQSWIGVFCCAIVLGMTIVIPPVNWGSLIFWICFGLFLTYCVFDPPKWLRRFYSGVWYIVWAYIQIAAVYAALIFGLLGIGYVFNLEF